MTPEQRARRMALVKWVVVGCLAVLLGYEAVALSTHVGWWGELRLFSITNWVVKPGDGGLGVGTWSLEARVELFLAGTVFFAWLFGHFAFGWTKGR